MDEKTRAEFYRIDRDEIPLPSADAAKRHAPTSLLLNGVHYCRRIVVCSRATCGRPAVRRIIENDDKRAQIRTTCPDCGLEVETSLGEEGKI